MIRKFVLFTGRKIRKLARAGRLKSRKLFGRDVPVEEEDSSVLLSDTVSFEPISPAVAKQEAPEKRPRTPQRQMDRQGKKRVWTLEQFEEQVS